ncbi:hypothetical protein B6A42_26995 (plasmid) [Vibrio coralliilyticus]|nr:hypothetical protein B6A42_26995 [Vibrio coralliilyticus]
MLKFKDFENVAEDLPYENSDEMVLIEGATERLNAWLCENDNVEVLNVESIYSQSDSMVGSSGTKFKLLRIWYKND